MSPRKILLEGRPGSGKTTVVRSLVEIFRVRGVPVAGFTTEEIREGGRRIGFRVESVSGRDATLAHIDLPGPPRVGKYGVDLASFELVALPSISEAAGVVIVDELGKMELASRPFQDAVSALFETDLPIVATVQASPHPLTDALKQRSDVHRIRISPDNRDTLPGELARLGGERLEARRLHQGDETWLARSDGSGGAVGRRAGKRVPSGGNHTAESS